MLIFAADFSYQMRSSTKNRRRNSALKSGVCVIGLSMAISNTLFMKQESQPLTYGAGLVKSKVDFIIMRLEDKAKVRNIHGKTDE